MNSEYQGTCARCGTAIKHVFDFNGKTYGSECISAVTGMRVRDLEFTDGSVDLEKTARTREERETRRQARLAENERLEQLMAEKRARYSALNADIIELLKGSWGDFAKDMADTLSYSALSELSERQFNIVSDIYAKTFGRRNSKAYNTAYDAIWDRREG